MRVELVQTLHNAAMVNRIWICIILQPSNGKWDLETFQWTQSKTLCFIYTPTKICRHLFVNGIQIILNLFVCIYLLSFFLTSSYKANYPLMKNCYKFYQQYKDQYECEKGSTKHGALANILICLEKAVQDGNIVISVFIDRHQQKAEILSINC